MPVVAVAATSRNTPVVETPSAPATEVVSSFKVTRIETTLLPAAPPMEIKVAVPSTGLGQAPVITGSTAPQPVAVPAPVQNVARMVRFQLQPDHLGEVSVALRLRGDELRVTVEVEQSRPMQNSSETQAICAKYWRRQVMMWLNNQLLSCCGRNRHKHQSSRKLRAVENPCRSGTPRTASRFNLRTMASNLSASRPGSSNNYQNRSSPRQVLGKWMVLPLVLAFTSSAVAKDAGVCEREMAAASAKYDVPLGVLYAVGLTETGRKGSLHPFALNIAGKTVFASSPSEALTLFHQSEAKGVKLIDLGCMQINHYYHGAEFRRVDDMLIPALNVDYAARFLSQLRVQEGSWTMAVARYHAGPDNNPAQKRYICAVIKNLVVSGFGAWTPQAKAFCQ